MLSTLAVLMATHTEQELLTFTEAEREIARERTVEPRAAAEPPAVPIAPAAPVVTEPARRADAQRSNVEPRTTQPLRKENRQLAAAPETPTVAREKAEASEKKVAEADAVAAARPQAGASPPASLPAPAAPPAASAPPAAESGSGTVGGLRSSESRQLRDERARGQEAPVGTAKTAVPSAKPAAVDEKESAIEQRPEEWLQKIVRLRTSGRHDEAEAELKRFRERYPQWPVPPAALAPAATR
jgi:hypothetical protein